MTAVVLCLCFEAMLADDYAIREHGHVIALHLVRTRLHRCHVLAIAAEHHPSAEVRSRCARLVAAGHAHRVHSYTPSTAPVWPCIDMTPEFPARWAFVSHWRDRAGYDQGTHTGPPYWHGWRRATELWVRDRIRAGWSHADADAVIGEMWLRELAYHERQYPHVLSVVRSWRGWVGGYPTSSE